MPSVSILSDNGALSGSAGLKTSGGNDGVLLLQTTTSGGTPTTAISISNTQVVTYTNQPTYTGGTANGVLYLNGSKAVTTGTALVFDGTNLGVGFSSPGSKLDVAGTVRSRAADNAARFDAIDTNSTGATITINAAFSGVGTPALQTQSNHPIIFAPNNTERMRLDTSGNLGIGASPSTVGTLPRALEFSYGVLSTYNSTEFNVSTNAYIDTNSWKYKASGAAALYQQLAGKHSWSTAGSGSAGGSVAWSNVMVLDASGRLGINTTPTDRPLEVAGAGTLGTQIKITNTGNSAGVQMNGARTFEIQSTVDSRFIVYDRTADLYRLWIDASGRMRVPYQPAFSAFGNSSNWAVPTASNDPIPYNQLDFDVASNYNTSTYAFTAPVAGKYYVSFAVLIYPNSIPSGVYITAWASINGASYTGGRAMARMSFKENQTTMGSDGILDLAAGDSVTIRANASGSGCTFYTNTGHAHFIMYLLG